MSIILCSTFHNNVHTVTWQAVLLTLPIKRIVSSLQFLFVMMHHAMLTHGHIHVYCVQLRYIISVKYKLN